MYSYMFSYSWGTHEYLHQISQQSTDCRFKTFHSNPQISTSQWFCNRSQEMTKFIKIHRYEFKKKKKTISCFSIKMNYSRHCHPFIGSPHCDSKVAAALNHISSPHHPLNALFEAYCNLFLILLLINWPLTVYAHPVSEEKEIPYSNLH